MSSEAHLQKVEKYINTVPALPAASPVDLNQVISLDPVLMAKVLKLINSAYYGVSTKVNSLVRAIIMLGIGKIPLNNVLSDQ